MFLSEKLVFVELHKTGCTHITRLLENTIPGQVIGKHNAPSPALINSPRLFVGSIRNPWEWYVSLWAYGCDQRGGVYHKVTKSNSIISLCRDWLVDPVYSASLLLNKVSRQPELWRQCYADVDDAAAFRRWLYMIHDCKHWHDFGQSYGKYPMSHVAGMLTYRYLRLFCKTDFKNINSLEQLQAFEKNNCYINYFIRNENLEQGFLAALDLAGIVLADDKKHLVNSIEKTNTSSKKHGAAYYYDADTIKLVRDREKLIIDKFAYQAPELGNHSGSN